MDNKFTIGDEVVYLGVECEVVDFRQIKDPCGNGDIWLYDLEGTDGDDAFNDVREGDIVLKADILPESIIAEYMIGGERRLYVYFLDEMNDCQHFFDDEQHLVRTMVKMDKGMSEEDYYIEKPICEVVKMVLAAEERIRSRQ